MFGTRMGGGQIAVQVLMMAINPGAGAESQRRGIGKTKEGWGSMYETGGHLWDTEGLEVLSVI